MYYIILKLVLYLHRKRTNADREQREANGTKVFKDFKDFKGKREKMRFRRRGDEKKLKNF